MRFRPALVASVGAFVAGSVLCAFLLWPLPIDLATSHLVSPFSDSHAWVLDQLGQGEVIGRSCAAGFPEARELRLIGWVPLLLGQPMASILGSLGATNLMLWLSLPVSAAATAWLLASWTSADRITCALLGVAFASCPTLLATLAGGELPKLQAWIFPLGLLALDAARTTWRGRLALAVLGLGAAFTSPYYALALPLCAGVVALVHLRSRPGVRGLAESAGLLAILALSMAPAGPYYAADRAGGGDAIFQPARRAPMSVGALPHPAPVASVDALLGVAPRAPGSLYEPQHVSALGTALVGLGMLGLVVGRGRGHWSGGALLVGGTALALGPALAWNGAWLGLGDRMLLLPVTALEALGYPTSRGGLYYRYAVVAVLGLCLLGARALAGRRWAPVAAALLLGTHLAQGLWLTGRTVSPQDGSSSWTWPRPVEEVADLALLATLAGDDGAVYELPIQGPTDGHLGQGALLRAIFHGRPTTGLPRDRMRGPDPARHALEAALEGGEAAPLTKRGFRYLILLAELDWYSDPDSEALTQAFGPPVHEGALLVWDLGPTDQSCLGGRSGARESGSPGRPAQ